MPNFIGLTTPGGERIMVNTDQIVTMTTDDSGATDAGAFITLANAGAIYVIDSIYEIVEMCDDCDD